jgi:hypothetical protein
MGMHMRFAHRSSITPRPSPARSVPLARRTGARLRPAVEVLEARCVLSTSSGNQPPTIAPLGSLLAAPGTQFAIQVVAQDVETPADRLTYSLAPGSSPHAQIDPATGLLRFFAPSSEGVERVVVVVSDDGSPPQSASERFDIVVSTVGFAGLAADPVGAVRAQLPASDLPQPAPLPSSPGEDAILAAPGRNLRVLPVGPSPLADTGVPRISESMAVAARMRVTVNRPEIPEPEAPQSAPQREQDAPAVPEQTAPPSPGSPEGSPQRRTQDAAGLLERLLSTAQAVEHAEQQQRDAAVAPPSPDTAEAASHQPQTQQARARHEQGLPAVPDSSVLPDSPAGASPSLSLASVADDAVPTPALLAHMGPPNAAVEFKPVSLDAQSDASDAWSEEAFRASAWPRARVEANCPPVPEGILQSALLLAWAPLRRGAVPFAPGGRRRLGRFERLARS